MNTCVFVSYLIHLMYTVYIYYISIYVHAYSIMIMTYSHATNLSIKKLHHPRPSSSFAASTFRPIVRSLAVINSWVMILGGNFHNIYLISLPISIYFNPNHHGHQSWGLILIKQGSLDGKGWFEWRKLFRVPFVDGGSKCTLLGEAMSVDAFLRTVRTGTRWTRLVEFIISNMKIEFALPGGLGALTLHDVTETTPAVTRSLRRALCPKRHVWAVLVDESLLFALMSHFAYTSRFIYFRKGMQRVYVTCEIACWERVRYRQTVKSKLCVFKTLSLFRPRKTQALSTSLQT